MFSNHRIFSSSLEAPAVLHPQYQRLDLQACSIWAAKLMSLIGDYREVLSWKLSCTEVGLAYISKFKSVPLLIHDGLPGLTLALRAPLMGMALNANPKRAACFFAFTSLVQYLK